MSLEIRAVTLDCSDPTLLSTFWQEALGYEIESNFGDFVFLRDPTGRGPMIGIQQVPEQKASKNRMHLDLHTADREQEISRLLGLGAREVERQRAGEFEWVVMADPEGNEFCVAG